jgi:CheY-like chemotaxis protein
MINIAMDADDFQKIQSFLNKANGASQHLLAIINDILDISKIEADKFELSHSDFDLERMLMNIVNVVHVRAEAKHQKFLVNLDKDVPLSIFGDELKLSQVITNLLTNAIKFTPENGKIILNIKKTEEIGDDITLEMEVEDSGIGIPEEQQKRLFTSFEQGDSSIAQNFGGTGLGLAISKRIVDLMGGRIWIESELGKGTKFIFTIKIKKGKEKNKTEPKQLLPSMSIGAINKCFGTESAKIVNKMQEKATANSLNFANCAILVAEDNEINREILIAILEKTGVSVDFAKNGEMAVSMFDKHPSKYSLILMDIQMPEMNGYEATRAIRTFNYLHAKDIPIIAMTASVFREDIEDCLSAGMNEHVGKPIDPDVLYEIIKKHIK